MQKNAFISKNNRIPIIIPAIIASVILNGLLLVFTTGMSMPFFLDSVFTVVITALFGLLPGLVTGFLSNFFFELLFGFPGHLYPFFVVNMLTALVTYLHVHFGDFTKASNALWMIISLSIVNAVFGAVIVVFLFEGTTYQPVDSIVRAVVTTGQSLLSSAFLGRILINIVDKGISVLIAFFVFRKIHKKEERS